MKQERLLNSTLVNIVAIILGTVVALVVAVNTSSEMPASSNIGAISPLINAVIFGVISLIAYLSLKSIMKNYGWIISLIGIITTIYSANFP